MKFIKSAFLIAACGMSASVFADQQDYDHISRHNGDIRHVLLISVDGLHAVDVEKYISANPNSALAELANRGITYTNANTPSLSDSFPGLLALVTGGSPVSHGVFYDVSYDRTYYAPGSNCAGAPGSSAIFDETIDKYNGLVSQNTIDPSALPLRKDVNGKCVAVYPHNFVKTNTIFEVAHANGLRTAWADKHPAYDLVNGPSGKGVTDLYTPEITNAPDGGFDATASVVCTVDNDQLKVNAILNQIRGKTSDGTHAAVPAIFGMNFQAVSVGQKIAVNNISKTCAQDIVLAGKPGGYLDADGNPTEVLAYGLNKTDEALQKMINALKDEGLYSSTLFIITAKHGQSPIDPAKTKKPGHFADLVASLNDHSEAANIIADTANCATGPCGLIQDDDIALIWLKDQSKAPVVAEFLNKNASALSIQNVLAGESLKLKFNNPLQDSRTPDIIVQPEYGTIYTSSSKKNAEHGGMSFTDTNVALIVANPRLSKATVKTPVTSSQVAPTILESLDIPAATLESVRIEHTQTLPGLFLSK